VKISVKVEKMRKHIKIFQTVYFLKIIYTRYSKIKVFVRKWNEIYMLVGHYVYV